MSHEINQDQSVCYGYISADELFSGFDPQIDNKLAALGRSCWFEPGSVILTPGSRPNIYLHKSGTVELMCSSRSIQTAAASPDNAGHLFGLLESLSDSEFQFGIRAVTLSELDLIDPRDFFRLVEDEPAIAFKLSQLAARETATAFQQVRN